MLLPTFLILGAQKSGTRWLRENLGSHPSVFAADMELEFFNHHFDRGLDWYSEQFAEATAIGEATPGYMFFTDGPDRVAERIRATLGADVALIAILRDPVERARSAYIHHLRRGRIDPRLDPLDYLRDLDRVADPMGIVSGGWYGRSLAPFAERFGKLLVEFHDDIETHGRDLYLRALDHIGVTDRWTPAALGEVRHSGVEPASSKFPEHPILVMDRAALAEVLIDDFDEDRELLESIINRRVPWPRETT